MFNRNNLWQQIQLSGLSSTRKFLIQLIGSRSTIGSTEEIDKRVVIIVMKASISAAKKKKKANWYYRNNNKINCICNKK